MSDGPDLARQSIHLADRIEFGRGIWTFKEIVAQLRDDAGEIERLRAELSSRVEKVLSTALASPEPSDCYGYDGADRRG